MEKVLTVNAGRLFCGLVTLVALFAAGVSAQSMFRKVNDFDGDGRADFAVTGVENGLKIWHIWQTTAGYKQAQWGLASDFNASGDYDGDGKTDIAVARGDQSFRTMTTYIYNSQTNSVTIKTVSAARAFFTGPQDYDGDGKADPAVTYTEGNTPVIYRSSQTDTIEGTQLPSGVVVRLGDLNGDGRAEAATYVSFPGEAGTLFIRNWVSSQLQSLSWGASGDEFVAADFDGDAKGEIAIFRPSSGEWWFIRSSDNVVNVARWGVNGDKPVPADYDNDGKTDIAVYRPGSPNGVYYIYGSLGGIQTIVWGTPSHTLVRY